MKPSGVDVPETVRYAGRTWTYVRGGPTYRGQLGRYSAVVYMLFAGEWGYIIWAAPCVSGSGYGTFDGAAMAAVMAFDKLKAKKKRRR